MLGNAIGDAATRNRTVMRIQPQTQTVVRRAPAVDLIPQADAAAAGSN